MSGGKKRGVVDFKKKKKAEGVTAKTKSAPLDPRTTERMASVIAGAIVLSVIAGIGILLISVGGRAYRYAVDPGRLVLQKIEVEGNVVLENADIAALSDIPLGATILDIDLQQVQTRIAAHPRIAAAVVERHLPNRMVIKVEERVPIGLVQEGGVIKGIDATGVVVPLMPAREEVKAPIITGDLAAVSRETLMEALNAIERMRPDLVQKISEMRLGGDGGFTLVTTGDPTIIRLGRGKMSEKIERLRTALAYFEETGQRKEIIDLRFDDIVTVP